MTKQTIINDVDVSGCEFYNSSVVFCWAYPDKLCKYNTNCYYKQLKQKEQSYETLANQYNAVVEQNKQLQTELNEIKKDIEVGIFCITCKKENENDKLRVKCEKYKKCLNEIKSNAQNACDNCQECTTEFNLQTSCEYYEILQIITEVENER